ncbi:MAG: class I SAM-dependent methyltransferase [Azospirillum sp.]|nr:class I SAM-dependent methyltransferase [Azospirillum sp.]MCA3266743.1 class I SAM-dependent methyltransferase [Azospirillum sp.]MCZ8123680.1 class I SAM-dependent methyltransferase [Magnetospirillum sp.]
MTDPTDALVQKIALAVMQTQWQNDRDLAHQMYALAVRESAVYANAKMPTATAVRPSKYPGPGRLEMLERALAMVTVKDGNYAEFGVYKGETLAFIADRIDAVAYGFDSFRGLSEDWFVDVKKGHFDLGGHAPAIRTTQGNIRLVNGYFADTIPEFKRAVPGPLAFMHIDCDLYESTKAIFEGLGDRIVPGTVIVFDEYLNYPGWQNHEYKAFQEFCAANGRSYEYKSFCPLWFSVALVMT